MTGRSSSLKDTAAIIIPTGFTSRQGDGGGGHCLVRMELRPAGWLMCLPLLIFPCTIKTRGSLLALTQPGGPGKRAIKRLCVVGVVLFPDNSRKKTMRQLANTLRSTAKTCK